MLRELKIKNLAIIDDLTIRFGEGLNVLTGETGAGKSIIVDALGLALGDRAQSELLRTGAHEASVQAFFEVDSFSTPSGLAIDCSEGLLLSRVLTTSGKSRAYINDTIVTLHTLSEVGKALVDIHSQHEHQSLLSAEKQMDIIDSFGHLLPDREQVAALHAETERVRKEYHDLTTRARDRAQRLDLLNYQINEIDAAALRADEQTALGEERKILANLGRLMELSDIAYASLYDSDGSCSENLNRAIQKLQEMSQIDQSAEEPLKLLEAALPLIQEASHILRGYRDRHDPDPARLEEIEDRLELIKKLGKKYGETISEILSFRNAAVREKEGLASSDERLESLAQELAKKETDLRAAAAGLSDKRRKTSRELDRLIEKELRDVAFANCSFRVDVRPKSEEEGGIVVSAQGIDDISFLFSANPGEPPKPLARIASGGELSRVMLALKSILAEVDNIPVLIFDEVDAGIGGKTAEHVGRKLDRIAKQHQLLCITHLPQIARFGSCHLKIEKKLRGSRVHVDVKELSGKERQDEIARMLSGDITDISLKHAESLLEKTK